MRNQKKQLLIETSRSASALVCSSVQTVPVRQRAVQPASSFVLLLRFLLRVVGINSFMYLLLQYQQLAVVVAVQQYIVAGAVVVVFVTAAAAAAVEIQGFDSFIDEILLYFLHRTSYTTQVIYTTEVIYFERNTILETIIASQALNKKKKNLPCGC